MLKKIISGGQTGADRYGRILGEVFADGNNVNLEMVKAGLAEVYRGTPASGQNLDLYWKAEEDAKKAMMSTTTKLLLLQERLTISNGC